MKKGIVKEREEYYKKNASALGWGEENPNLDTQRVKLLKEYLVGTRVLEVGCGYGKYVDFVCSLGYEGFGVDIVDKFITSAKKNKKGEYVVGSAEKLPFKDNFFDTVILFDILEHGDDRKILKEAQRVTSQRIIVVVPREVDKNLSDSGVVFRHYIDKTHLREYNEKSIEKLSADLNLKIEFIKKIHPLNNEIVFKELLDGNPAIVDLVRMFVFNILPPKIYDTEYFVVLKK